MKLQDCLKPTQNCLMEVLAKHFKKAIVRPHKYLYVQGESPILLVAHLDTVHREPVKDICYSTDGNILMSPQGIGGDDRCGVYALIKAYKNSKVKPHLLFTCDEEIGGIGAKAFAKEYEWGCLPRQLDQIKCIVEIDRKGSNDAVYYECANEDFENYITSKGFKTATGSYSDIVDLSPALGVASVNLSSGYYNQHTCHEYINVAELENVIERVIGIVEDVASDTFPKYEFVEKIYDSKIGYSWDEITDWYGQEEEESFFQHYYELLDMIPESLWDLCEELLEYYAPIELIGYVEIYGESILHTLDNGIVDTEGDKENDRLFETSK